MEAVVGRREFLISKGHHEPLELAVLVGLGGGTALAASWLLRDLPVHPAGFSEPDLRRP